MSQQRRSTELRLAAAAVAADVGWDGALVVFAQAMQQGLAVEARAREDGHHRFEPSRHLTHGLCVRCQKPPDHPSHTLRPVADGQPSEV